MNLFVICPGKNSQAYDQVFYLIVAETGEVLATHFCSSPGFALGDLYAHRNERIDKWKERFGEFEVKYIDETDISLEEILARNKKFYEEKEKQEEIATADKSASQ